MEDRTTTSETPAKRKLPVVPVAAGLLLAPLAFVFGAFAAVIVVPAALPWFKRLRPTAYAAFGGIAACWLASAAGANPWLDWGRSQALQSLEAALGGPIEYTGFSGDAATGKLLFTGVSVQLPDDVGHVEARTLEINPGLGLFLRTGPAMVAVQGLTAEFDPAGGKLERFLARPRESASPVVISVRDGSIALKGDDTAAEFEFSHAEGSLGGLRDEFSLGLSRGSVTLLGVRHELTMMGGVAVRQAGSGLEVVTNIAFQTDGLVQGALMGSLTPGGESSLLCTLDHLELKELWGRYRKVDVLEGALRGTCRVSGELNDLRLELSCELSGVSYYYPLVMGLDATRAFELPEADLSGDLRLQGGTAWSFSDLTLRADDCTLSTNPRCKARGAGELVLNGPVDDLRGTFDATVREATLNEPISWVRANRTGLSDLTPNIVMLGEQFPALTLEWQADVRRLEVNCDPVRGVARGKLRGDFTKRPENRSGNVRAEGSLEMKDGELLFLGLTGSVDARIEMHRDVHPRHATLRGMLMASAGDTPVQAEITGRLDRPGVRFTGMTMSPEQLGRVIYRHSDVPLTAAQQQQRRDQCARLCGPQAAAEQNPFLVASTRDPAVVLHFAP